MINAPTINYIKFDVQCCLQSTDVGQVIISVMQTLSVTIQPRHIAADVSQVSMATERSVSVSAVSMAIRFCYYMQRV